MKFKLMGLLLIHLAGVTNAQDQTEFNLLFVGNSLTSSNDLPKLVRQQAASLGITVTTQKVVKGGYAIVDHWAEGRVQRLINNNRFDFVIIQQGPSSQMAVPITPKFAKPMARNWPILWCGLRFPGIFHLMVSSEITPQVLKPIRRC